MIPILYQSGAPLEFRTLISGLPLMPYIACKHIYFVFLMVLGQDVNNNMHIHQAKFPNYILKELLTQSKRSHPHQL